MVSATELQCTFIFVLHDRSMNFMAAFLSGMVNAVAYGFPDFMTKKEQLYMTVDINKKN